MGVNIEGPVSALVTDAMKVQCSRCNGVKFSISTTMDDPADVAGATDIAALDITKGAGTDPIGLVTLCVQCGAEQVPLVYIFDVGTFNGTTGLTGTDLDAGVINNLAGWFVCILVGTDIGKYVAVASNSVADPSAIVLAFNVNTNADGIFMITNIEPIGLTKIVA